MEISLQLNDQLLSLFLSMRSGNPAIELLKHEFHILMTTKPSLECFASIAHYLKEIGELQEAGQWYERAGKLCIARNSGSLICRALSSVSYFSKALECFSICGDTESVERVSEIISELSRAYSAS
jgi:hypothetical protein